MSEMSDSDDRICGTGFTEKDFEESLKPHLQRMGIEVTNIKTEPYGNEPCTCGSGNRYDMCCSGRKLL